MIYLTGQGKKKKNLDVFSNSALSALLAVPEGKSINKNLSLASTNSDSRLSTRENSQQSSPMNACVWLRELKLYPPTEIY